MSTLIIRKKSLKTWLHTDSILGDFIISKFYFNADNGNFQVVEQGQSKRVIYDVTDITLYDDTDGGVAETFANITALSLRLEELNYPAFQYDGQIVSIANLIEAGTNVTITGDGTEASPYVISATGGGGGGAVDSVNSQTGVVSIDLQSVLTEGNESTTQDAIFRLDADKYIKIDRASQRIELWDESIDDTIPITHWDKDSFYIKDAAGNQMSISAGYTNNLFTDGSTFEMYGSNIVLTNAGLFFNLTNELMQFGNGGGDLSTYTLDKIVVNGVDYPLPTGATSQIATLLDIPTIDATPTDGSSNAVSSNGVFDALALKQDKVTGVSDTEIGYLDGVTSAIQTQLDNRSKIIWKLATPTSANTGTTSKVLMASSLVSANTLSTSEILRLVALLSGKTVFTNTTTVRLEMNTTASLSGSTVLATTQITGVNNFNDLDRRFVINGGNIKGLLATAIANSDVIQSTVGFSTNAIDVTNDFYLLISHQHNTSSDSSIVVGAEVVN